MDRTHGNDRAGTGPDAWEQDPRAPSAPSEDMAALYEELRARVQADRGPLAWLRSLPTPWRIGIVVGVVAVLAAVQVGLSGAWSAGAPWWARTAVPAAALLLLLGVATAHTLRPLHRPAPPVWHGLAWVTAAAVAPVAVAAGTYTEGLVNAAPCLGFGLLMSLPVLGTWWAVERGASGVGRVLLLAAAAGLGGNVLLQFHCANTAPGHLLVGHGGIVWVLGMGALGWAVWSLGGRRSSPPR
jgi:hypothetical protein